MEIRIKIPANKEITALSLLLNDGCTIEKRSLTDNDSNIILNIKVTDNFNIYKYPDYVRVLNAEDRLPINFVNWNHITLDYTPAMLSGYAAMGPY